jgi:hypothetical protein
MQRALIYFNNTAGLMSNLSSVQLQIFGLGLPNSTRTLRPSDQGFPGNDDSSACF